MLERTWNYKGKSLFRAEKLYTAKNYQSFIETFRANFSDYLYYCPFRDKELITAPLNKIEQVFVPRERLQSLLKLKHPDKLQKMAIDLLEIVSKESDVGFEDLGIHGSIALNMHAPESDIDFVAYGSKNFRRVEEAIAGLVNKGKLSYIFGNRIEAARRFQGRYLNKIFMYNATRQPDEIRSEYGEFKFFPLSPLRFQCTISDDTQTMFRPATYKITNYKPLDAESDLLLEKIPDRVISNIGCYRNIARQGDEIKVAGTLERVESTKTSEVFYQIVVGTATSEEEYIWPIIA